MQAPGDPTGRQLSPVTAVRNRLSEFFLAACADPERGGAVLWLLTYCRLARPEHMVLALPALAEAVGGESPRTSGANPARPLETLLAEFALFQLRHLDTAMVFRGREAVEALRWSAQDGIELASEFGEFWTYVAQRAQRYWAVVQQLMQRSHPSKGGVEGAVCLGVLVFNAGLFFEYHELLEDHWRAATSDRKRFLQGLIQVAVGLHHWEHGNYNGAVTLLREGAERLVVGQPSMLGLDVRSFCEAVQAVRSGLEMLGRQHMQELSPTLLPRQRLVS